MIDPKKQYKTRDGREVRIYAVDGGGTYPVHGAIFEDLEWNHQSWAEDGRFDCCKGGAGDELDLIEVKPRIKREVWVNVYEDGHVSLPYKTQQIANAWAGGSSTRIACVKLTIDVEEGHGLD